MNEPRSIHKRFSKESQNVIKPYKNPKANNIKSIQTMQDIIDLIPAEKKEKVLKEWENIKKELQTLNNIGDLTSLFSTPEATKVINALKGLGLTPNTMNKTKPEEKVYQDIQISQSKNTIPNFKYSSIKDFNFIGDIKTDNIKNEETYIELSVNISFDLYELYNVLVQYSISFHLVDENSNIVHNFEDTALIKDDIIKGNLIDSFQNRFANIPKDYQLVDKINYYEIQDNSGSRLYFVDDYLDIDKYMFFFGSSSIGPSSIHPYKSLMIYFVNHVKRINIGAVMLTPNRQSYIIHCLAIPIDKNDLCSSARIEFYSYPEKYTLYLNLSDVLVKA